MPVLCPRCFKQPCEAGRKACRPCLNRVADSERRRVKRQMKAGLCIKCNKPPEEGKTMCEYHLKYYAKKQRKRYKKALTTEVH